MTSSNPFSDGSNAWLQQLLQSPPNELGPGKAQVGALEEAQQSLAHLVKPAPTLSAAKLECAKSWVALWAVCHDCLNTAHEISQEMKSDLGSYIHGIVHRREPDYSNAKYWFRQVGELPFYRGLQAAARDMLAECHKERLVAAVLMGDSWRPMAFVDLCEFAIRGPKDLHLACRKVQQRELELALQYCLSQIQR